VCEEKKNGEKWKPEFGNPYPGVIMSREELLKELVSQPYEVRKNVTGYTASIDHAGGRILGYLVRKDKEIIKEVVAIVAVKYEVIEDGVATVVALYPIRMHPWRGGLC